MINLNSVSAQLYFTTARLSARLDNGVSIGTGFFINFKIDEKRFLPCLITNWHVVKDSTTVEFKVHESIKKDEKITEPSISCFSVTIHNSNTLFVQHPAGVDLCAIPFEPIRLAAQQQGKGIFYRQLDESMLPSQKALESLLGMEEVVMVGYPKGLCDEANNLPVLRRGVTASHPAINFDGKNWGAVDIGFFQGSSGSPIIVCNEGVYASGKEIKVGSRTLLLGVLFGGPVYQADGTIKIGPNQALATQTQMPFHIGYYIKASEVLVLKDAVLKKFGK